MVAFPDSALLALDGFALAIFLGIPSSTSRRRLEFVVACALFDALASLASSLTTMHLGAFLSACGSVATFLADWAAYVLLVPALRRNRAPGRGVCLAVATLLAVDNLFGSPIIAGNLWSMSTEALAVAAWSGLAVLSGIVIGARLRIAYLKGARPHVRRFLATAGWQSSLLFGQSRRRVRFAANLRYESRS